MITEDELLQELVNALELSESETPLSEGFTRGDLERAGYTEGRARRSIKKWLSNGLIQPSPTLILRKTVHGVLSSLPGYVVVK